jgi:hypothetical protein
MVSQVLQHLQPEFHQSTALQKLLRWVVHVARFNLQNMKTMCAIRTFIALSDIKFPSRCACVLMFPINYACAALARIITLRLLV